MIKPDILFLQECGISDYHKNKWCKPLNMTGIWKHHRSGTDVPTSQGVAILFSKKLRPMIQNSKTDEDAYYVIVDVSLDEQRYTLANMHAQGVPHWP